MEAARELGRRCHALQPSAAETLVRQCTDLDDDARSSLLRIIPAVLGPDVEGQPLCHVLREPVGTQELTTAFFMEAPYTQFVLRLMRRDTSLVSDASQCSHTVRIMKRALERAQEKMLSKVASIICDIHSILTIHVERSTREVLEQLCLLWRQALHDVEHSGMLSDDTLIFSLSQRLEYNDAVLVAAIFGVAGASDVVTGKATHHLIEFAAETIRVSSRAHLEQRLMDAHVAALVTYMEKISEHTRWHSTLVDWFLRWSHLAVPVSFGTIVANLVSGKSLELMLRLHKEHRLDLLIRQATRHASGMDHAKHTDWRVVCACLLLWWPSHVRRTLNLPKLSSNRVACSAHICPITQLACDDPVVASDGQTYERDAIVTYMCQSKAQPPPSPVTKQLLSYVMYENYAVRN